MKQEYSAPELEVVIFNRNDVITQSPNNGDTVTPEDDWWNS